MRPRSVYFRKVSQLSGRWFRRTNHCVNPTLVPEFYDSNPQSDQAGREGWEGQKEERTYWSALWSRLHAKRFPYVISWNCHNCWASEAMSSIPFPERETKPWRSLRIMTQRYCWLLKRFFWLQITCQFNSTTLPSYIALFCPFTKHLSSVPEKPREPLGRGDAAMSKAQFSASRGFGI